MPASLRGNAALRRQEGFPTVCRSEKLAAEDSFSVFFIHWPKLSLENAKRRLILSYMTGGFTFWGDEWFLFAAGVVRLPSVFWHQSSTWL
jgi:hypothetical protein